MKAASVKAGLKTRLYVLYVFGVFVEADLQVRLERS